MRIAFFHLAFLYSGGGEKLALKEIELLLEQGHTVDIFSPLIDTTECYPDQINAYKIQEIIPGFSKLFHNKPELGVIITCALFPFFIWKYRSYDLVFGANQPSAIFGLFMKAIFGIPYIIYLAQPTRFIYPRPIDRKYGLKLKNKMKILPHFINIFRPFIFWIDLKSILCADQFLCNGYYMQDILQQVYGKTPIVCPAGAEYCDKQQPTQPYLLVTNRHAPQKQIELAIEIIRTSINKYHLPLTLKISGSPTNYTQSLLQLVEQYELKNSVQFLGYVDDKALTELYKNCFAYIYTAPEEDFGMGIIEAMGYGKPVIAWNKAGPSKIITSGIDGFLENINDTQTTAQILYRLFTNSKYYADISSNAVQTVQNKFSWDNHSEIIEQTISKVVPQKIIESAQTIAPAILTD